MAFIWWNPFGVADADAMSMGFYLLMWGIFTLFMFVATLKLNNQLKAIFGTLTILFFLLALGDFTGSETIATIAGWEGIVCGATAVYSAMHQVITEVYCKK